MGDSLEYSIDSFDISDEYLSEEDLTAEITDQQKATQRKGKNPQKNAEFILEN